MSNKFLNNLLLPENVPAIVLLSGSILIIGLIMGVAMMKSIDEEDDDCFSEEQTAKLVKHNEQIKEGFQTNADSYEKEEDKGLEEEANPPLEKPDWNPDILIVLRTDYKTASALAQEGVVEEFIGMYPTPYAIKKLNPKSYRRRYSM